MKNRNLLRITASLAACALAFSATSCTTTYDAYGRPKQTVDPGLAVAGIAAAGLIGYAIANDSDDHHKKHKSHRSHRSHRHHDYNSHHSYRSYGGSHYGYNSCSY
ncbi:hypothetical protein [Sulfuriroseicoccus oceanibius]|uniref:Lipoprotein n=1 Tax=Sulfuriroseicoccus oceanibius TaxID=2707525 RepID=A0A6B3L1H6_9BACT|nr:hypothetical protein [Sulfuriroseicoccus oceanibius]QQL46154.1 hypothetical protein G3M56_006120 [Sulfuriroseicoccus oceanibius]